MASLGYIVSELCGNEMKKSRKWTDILTIKFMELYEAEEVLWNVRLDDYKNKDARNSALERIAKGMDIPDFSAKDVLKKINTMRTTYKQEADKVDASSGVSNLGWYKIADRFLRDVMNYRSNKFVKPVFNSSAPMQSTMIRKREGLVAEMEKLLVAWIEQERRYGVDISFPVLQAKAKMLYEEVKQRHRVTSHEETFHASRGWYTRFKSRLSWQNREQEVTGQVFETVEEPPVEVKSEIPDLQNMVLPGPSSVDNYVEMYPLRRRVPDWTVPQQAPPGTKQVVPPTPPMKKSLPQTSQPSPKPAIPKPAPVRPVSPPQPPPPPPEVCLRWNSYHSNMQATFPSLLNNEQFVDVTLACEGRSIKCHKMMLSACSSYFEELLSQNPCQHPIVLMKDLKFWEVQALVDFMYRGEVNVGQDKLPSLLAAAEALQIKGLAGPASTSSSHDEDSLPPSLPIATEDYLDDSASSPSSARRARKRRTIASMPTPHPPPAHQQNTLNPPNRNPVGRPRLMRPSPQPSTSYMASEPPLRRARRSEPTALPVGEIKLEPVDIDISNDSMGNDSMDQDDGFDLKKTYGNTGGNGNGNNSSRRPDEPGDGGGGGGEDREMTDSICDNSALLSGHDSENMDYGNNNRMNSESAETGTTDDQNTEIQGFSYTEGSSNDPTMSTSETNPSYPEVVLNPDNASSDSILGHV